MPDAATHHEGVRQQTGNVNCTDREESGVRPAKTHFSVGTTYPDMVANSGSLGSVTKKYDDHTREYRLYTTTDRLREHNDGH